MKLQRHVQDIDMKDSSQLFTSKQSISPYETHGNKYVTDILLQLYDKIKFKQNFSARFNLTFQKRGKESRLQGT